MPVRVALADDSLLMREGVQQLLAAEPEIELVASCADLEELLDAVTRTDVDVVLTDIRMPPTMSDEGIRVAGRSPLASLTPRERDVLAEIAQGKSNTAI